MHSTNHYITRRFGEVLKPFIPSLITHTHTHTHTAVSSVDYQIVKFVALTLLHRRVRERERELGSR